MVDVAIRLRRAIAQNDLAVLKRILRNHPSYLQNPDLSDKSNTSLHLAAQYGFVDIAEHLISLGHDASGPATTGPISWHSITTLGPSYNTDGDTALHLAASHSHPEIVELLCSHFPTTINRANKAGATPLQLASRAHPPSSSAILTQSIKGSSKRGEDNSTVDSLLKHNADVHALDNKGASSLHYAATWGNLKAVRALIQAGADPLQQDEKGWTPQYYSLTVQAEVYYRNLVAEWEKQKARDAIRTRERRGKGGGRLRLVKDEDHDREAVSDEDETRARAESMESVDELDISLQRDDAWK